MIKLTWLEKQFLKKGSTINIYDLKKKNLYFLDVKTGYVYADFNRPGNGRNIEFSNVFIYLTTPTVAGIVTFFREQAYLGTEMQDFKMHLLICSLLIGIILGILINKIGRKPTVENLRKKYPYLRQIRKKELLDEVNGVARDMVTIGGIAIILFSIVSLFFYQRFLEDNNLVTIIWGLLSFAVVIMSVPRIKDVSIFVDRTETKK